MSIYRKFIESAAEPSCQFVASAHQHSGAHSYNYKHNYKHNQQQQHQQQHCGLHQSPHRHPASAIKFQEAAGDGDMLQGRKGRTQPAAAARLSPRLASVVGSTMSSTPVRKHHQYRRLVETADHYTGGQQIYVHAREHDREHERPSYQPSTASHCQDMTASCQNIHDHYASRRAAHLPQAQLVGPSQGPAANRSPFSQQAQRCLSLASIQRAPPMGGRNPPQVTAASANIYEPHAGQRSWHQRAKSVMARPPAALVPSVSRPAMDPVLARWMRAMRFETELECLTALQARTLAIDEHSAAALSVRNSQVTIQETRLESDLILGLVDCLIDSLPVNFRTLDKFAMDFSELYVKLLAQTRPQTGHTATGGAGAAATTTTTTTTLANSNVYCNQLKQHNNLTIINCTPRKSQVSARTLKPLDKLSIQIRELCIEVANTIENYQGQYNSYEHIDNGGFEASLRKVKELFGKFVEISIRAECANIVRALEHDFGARGANPLALAAARSACSGGSSSASLRPVRPYESSSAQLPLKWALIALWQLTKDDGYICRTLTERWQTGDCGGSGSGTGSDGGGGGGATGPSSCQKPRSARRLDYSTKYDQEENNNNNNNNNNENKQPEEQHSLRADYEKLYQICQSNEQFREKQQRQQPQRQPRQQGALSSALESKQGGVRHVSTIELLIDIIISQPNKHERVDMINFLQENKLVELEELDDQSISAAFYTSNQYKVAALRILNHLCINDQAVKTILKCFSTPPPKQGQPAPENKIVKSVFECYQTAQEHIYQNETMLRRPLGQRTPKRARKRARRHSQAAAAALADACAESEEYSDYGSRQTASNSAPTSCELDALSGGRLSCGDEDDDDYHHHDQDHNGDAGDDDDDAVVKEAVRLLVQLTTPFYRSTQGQDYYTLIGRFSIESLVKYLTNIIKASASREMLLLCLSALANISFITTEPMRHFGTTAVVLEMLRSSRNRARDLELRDQTVTLLANAADKNLMDVVSNGGLSFLLSSLEVCPTRMSNYKFCQPAQAAHDYATVATASTASMAIIEDPYGNIGEPSERLFRPCQPRAAAQPASQARRQLDNTPRDRKPIDLGDDELLEDLDCACDTRQPLGAGAASASRAARASCLSRLSVNEMAALERIHQKTAVAIARMSSDPNATRLVLKHGGIKQLIDLCKLGHKRNHSETVLIACLAALRKVAKVTGRDPFRHYNALDLIELEPARALEIYGRLYASEV